MDALLLGRVGSVLRNQRVVLVTSAKGATRRSNGLTQYMLRQKLNCTVFNQVVTEPSLACAAQCEKLAKHTSANVMIALGGSTVMDCAKLACVKSEMDHFIAIPTLPCAGGENNLNVNLFDFDGQSEVTLRNFAPPHLEHSCIVDAELGLGDKIPSKTDIIAVMNTLCAGLASCNEEFVLASGHALQSIVHEENKSFSAAHRQSFFHASLALSSKTDQMDKSFQFALTNAICLEIPLPRSMVQAALFFPSFAVQMGVTDGQALREMTRTNTLDEAARVAEKLTRIAGLERGVVGLLPLFFNAENSGKLIPVLLDVFKQCASEHNKKHGGELHMEEMLFGLEPMRATKTTTTA